VNNIYVRTEGGWAKEIRRDCVSQAVVKNSNEPTCSVKDRELNE